MCVKPQEVDFVGLHFLSKILICFISFSLELISLAVPQSCTVAKSEQFWQATGQSNFTDRMEDYSTGQSAVV